MSPKPSSPTPQLTAERRAELAAIAAKMLADGQGILAADESSATIAKRLDSIKLESTEATRAAWRGLLFSSTAAMKPHIGGAILFEETLFQKDESGQPMTAWLRKQDCVIGIKVDKGAKPLALCPGETITEGLDGLRARLQTYHAAGARFAKWRAVLHMGAQTPSRRALQANMEALAQYAALSQEEGLVPIVEPEVLMDGAHDIHAHGEATWHSLQLLYQALFAARVWLEGTVLKPNMVLSGSDCAQQAGADEVAEATVRILRASVPAAVPGIAFLSGGQSDVQATAHLDKINRLRAGFSLPWRLSFSYGRALQAAPLRCWGGQKKNAAAAQAVFAHRAKMNGLAAQGQWRAELESEAA